MAMVFCRGCGKEIHESAVSCPLCGAVQGAVQVGGVQVAAVQVARMPQAQLSASDKRILPAFLMCFFIGFLGIHRFYVGRIGTGVAMLLTAGGLGVWVLSDLIILAPGSFTGANGNKIDLWT